MSGWKVYDQSGTVIATAARQADAQHISVLPEMMAALKDLLATYGNLKPEGAAEDEAARRARDVIAKAEIIR